MHAEKSSNSALNCPIMTSSTALWKATQRVMRAVMMTTARMVMTTAGNLVT